MKMKPAQQIRKTFEIKRCATFHDPPETNDMLRSRVIFEITSPSWNAGYVPPVTVFPVSRI